MKNLEIKPIHNFLGYEIRSSWWASWISWNWGQELLGSYFAWKTRRKYARYKQSKLNEDMVRNYNPHK